MPVEKFHFLEADIHVPFLVRGPGVPPGTKSSAIVSNIDIGATILDLAGVQPASTPTDGQSFAWDLRGGSAGTPTRDRTLIEYGRWGTGYFTRGPCPSGCGVCEGEDKDLNMLMDGPSDVYTGMRIINATHNIAYAEFSQNASVPDAHSSTNWTECYDLNADPWQMINIALLPANAPFMAQLSSELWSIAHCSAGDCP